MISGLLVGADADLAVLAAAEGQVVAVSQVLFRNSSGRADEGARVSPREFIETYNLYCHGAEVLGAQVQGLPQVAQGRSC